MIRRFTLSLAVSVLVLLIAGNVSVAASRYQFKLGFLVLANQIPDIAGQAVEDEHHNPLTGDGLQLTTTGLMVWRKADNWTAFTNGSRTWINGPQGLQERANDGRFDWEAASSPAASPSGATSAATSLSVPAADADVAAEQAALTMINDSRRQGGAGPVAMDAALRQIAREHARDMSKRNYFAHGTPEGLSPFDRMAAAGIKFRWAAENIGWSDGYATPTEGVRANHNAMMAEAPPEDGHRRNILNSNLHKVGIGVYTGGNGKVYYVTDFTD